MKKKQDLITIGAVAVIVAGIAFWGGMSYAQSKSPAARFAQGNFQPGQFAGRAGGARASGAGAVFGTIIAKDASSITVQLGGPNATSTNGTATGSKIVLLGSGTQVSKFVQGSPSDLTVGTMVTANGTPNSDGSITAAIVQIRPAGTNPRGQ